MTTVKQSWEGLDNEALRAQNDARLKTFTPGTAGFHTQDYGKNKDGTNKLYSQLTGAERQSYGQKFQERKNAYGKAYDEVGNKDSALAERGRLEGEANEEAFNALTPEQQNNIEQAIGDPNSPLYGMQAKTAYGFLRRLGTTAGDIGQPKELNLSSIFMPGGGADFGSAQSDSTNEGLNALPNSQTNTLLATFMNSSIFTDASAQDKKDMLSQLAPIFEMLQPTVPTASTVSTVGQPGPQTVAVRGGF